LTPSDTTWALQAIDDTIGKAFRNDVLRELEDQVLMKYDWRSNEKGTLEVKEKRKVTAKTVQTVFDRWAASNERKKQIMAACLRTGLAITLSNAEMVVPNRYKAPSLHPVLIDHEVPA
jgi:hypothetical protein